MVQEQGSFQDIDITQMHDPDGDLISEIRAQEIIEDARIVRQNQDAARRYNSAMRRLKKAFGDVEEETRVRIGDEGVLILTPAYWPGFAETPGKDITRRAFKPAGEE